jgi:hypothetical protein
LGFGVWGLGFGVWVGVWGLGFGVWGLGFGVWVGTADKTSVDETHNITKTSILSPYEFILYFNIGNEFSYIFFLTVAKYHRNQVASQII